MISRFVLGTLFVLAGLNHFRAPEIYLPMMPPALPFPRELILLSGAAEVVGGVLLWPRKTRKFAGFWLLALLILVFPANVHAALVGLEFGGKAVPAWILWARLPLQIPLMWWVWRASQSD